MDSIEWQCWRRMGINRESHETWREGIHLPHILFWFVWNRKNSPEDSVWPHPCSLYFFTSSLDLAIRQCIAIVHLRPCPGGIRAGTEHWRFFSLPLLQPLVEACLPSSCLVPWGSQLWEMGCFYVFFQDFILCPYLHLSLHHKTPGQPDTRLALAWRVTFKKQQKVCWKSAKVIQFVQDCFFKTSSGCLNTSAHTHIYIYIYVYYIYVYI